MFFFCFVFRVFVFEVIAQIRCFLVFLFMASDLIRDFQEPYIMALQRRINSTELMVFRFEQIFKEISRTQNFPGEDIIFL